MIYHIRNSPFEYGETTSPACTVNLVVAMDNDTSHFNVLLFEMNDKKPDAFNMQKQ